MNREPRLAIITGGTGGLGSALAEVLCEAGYEVEAPGRSELDVTDPASVSQFFSRHDRVGLLVNNAGLVADQLSAKMGAASFGSVLDVNLTGAWRCCRAALEKMPPGEGHIVNIGSHAAWDGKIGQANYAASKAGLLGLTKSLAREVGSRGIRVNCVAPGFMETKMTRGMSEAAVKAIREAHCLGCFSRPEDVAHFILCLDRMPAVSGQVFRLDSRIGA